MFYNYIFEVDFFSGLNSLTILNTKYLCGIRSLFSGFIERCDAFGFRSMFPDVSEERWSFEMPVNRPANNNAAPRLKIHEPFKPENMSTFSATHGRCNESRTVAVCRNLWSPYRVCIPLSTCPQFPQSPFPPAMGSKQVLIRTVRALSYPSTRFLKGFNSLALTSHQLCKPATKVNKLRNL